jgi:hypothetical protein
MRGPQIFMSTILKYVRDLLVVLALAFLVLVLYDVHHALDNTAGQARYTLDNANRLIRELAQTSANLRHATAEWETASKQQSAYFTAAAQKSGADLDAVRDLIAHTDGEVNGNVLPQLSKALASQDAALSSFEGQAGVSLQQLTETTAALRPAIASATAATASAAQLAADPAIKNTLTHVDQTTASLASAMASVDRQVRMIEPVTKKATTPPSKAAFIFNTALDLAAKLGSALAGFAK